MATHTDIVKRVGPAVAADLTGVSIYTARSWAQRNSIPAEHWAAFVNAGHCTAEELMLAAARRAA